MKSQVRRIGFFAAFAIVGLGLGFASTRLAPTPVILPAYVADPAPAVSRGEPIPEVKRDPAAPADPKKRALLIGVTEYKNLPKANLHGPANDVDLTRQTLQDVYNFPPANIDCLTENEKDPSKKPTRANIVRAFAELEKAAVEGDQVFVLLAGHGAQQPESPNPAHPEQDGVDEIFLPSDIRPWDAEKKCVPNAIVDDELGEWLRALTAKKVYVCAVFDCCHSGTITRSAVATREMSRETLNIPTADLKAARERAAKRVPSQSLFPIEADSKYMAAISACASHETTPEDRMTSEVNAPVYGLLSYTLNGVLRTANAAGQPLTHAELTKRIQIKYLERTNGSQTPNVEGGGQDRFVFDTKEVKRPPFVLTVKGQEYRANAGHLHGVTTGSVLAVYSPAGELEADKLLGYASVVNAEPLAATVKPFAYLNKPARKDFPNGARCEVAFWNYGSPTLRIAVHAEEFPHEKAAASQRSAMQVLEHITAILKDKPDMFKLTKKGDMPGPDYEIVCSGDQLAFKENTGGEALQLPCPQLANEKFRELIAENIRKLHRLRSLVDIAAKVQESQQLLKSQESQLRLKSQVSIRIDTLITRGDKTIEIPSDSHSIEFRGGDRVAFRITNTSESWIVTATLLVAGMDGSIVPFYPAPGELGKVLKPKESFITPNGPVGNDPPFGREQLVAIAVPETEKLVDFRTLAQPALKARGFDPNHALALVLERAMDGVGERGPGLGRDELPQLTMQVLGYRTVPATK